LFDVRQRKVGKSMGRRGPKSKKDVLIRREYISRLFKGRAIGLMSATGRNVLEGQVVAGRLLHTAGENSAKFKAVVIYSTAYLGFVFYILEDEVPNEVKRANTGKYELLINSRARTDLPKLLSIDSIERNATADELELATNGST